MTAAVKVKPARRDYGKRADGKRRPGVTTVIGDTLGWSKNALMAWSAKEAAKAAVQGMLDGGHPDDVADRARTAHYKIRDAAADAGKLAHEYIEAFLRSGAAPEEPGAFDEPETEVQGKARHAFEKIRAWWPSSGYEMVEAELALVDETSGYGGTIDVILRRKSDGVLIVGDVKTGKSVYDETLLQLGAYSLLAGKHGHPVTEGVIIHCPVTEGEPCTAVEVSAEMLALGASAFVSLFWIYTNRPALALKMEGKGGVP